MRHPSAIQRNANELLEAKKGEASTDYIGLALLHHAAGGGGDMYQLLETRGGLSRVPLNEWPGVETLLDDELTWRETDKATAEKGHQLKNDKLREALRAHLRGSNGEGQTEKIIPAITQDQAGRYNIRLAASPDRPTKVHFKQDQWDTFGVRGLRVDHYVKVDDNYFVPTGTERCVGYDLDERHWGSISSLPPEAALSKLKKIVLSRCPNLLELPSSISQCADLETLVLGDLTGGCDQMAELPSMLGQCTKLRKLDLTLCGSLQKLPESICECVQLETLCLRGCAALQALPNRLHDCVNLLHLTLEGCVSVVKLPELREYFEREAQVAGCHERKLKLVLRDCRSLASLPDLSKYPPGTLDVVDLPERLQHWQTGGYLEWELFGRTADKTPTFAHANVKHIDFSRFQSKGDDLPDLSGFRELHSLSLSYSLNLLQLPELPNGLQELQMRGCAALMRVPKLPLTLRVLNLADCTQLRSDNVNNERLFGEEGSSEIIQLPNLETLNLARCTSLLDLPPHFFSACPKLWELNLDGCANLAKIPDSLTKLKHVLRVMCMCAPGPRTKGLASSLHCSMMMIRASFLCALRARSTAAVATSS